MGAQTLCNSLGSPSAQGAKWAKAGLYFTFGFCILFPFYKLMLLSSFYRIIPRILHPNQFSTIMVKLLTLASCFFATLIGQSAGHFVVLYPPSVGFDEDVEGNAPCGGFPVDFSKDNVTDFHVGGDVLALVRESTSIRRTKS